MNRTNSRFYRFLTILAALTLFLRVSPSAFAESRQEQLDRKIAQIVSQIPASADTDAEKALYLHDYIVLNVSYELVGDHQTAFGALLDGKAVCAGYADAYKRLLTAVGIRAHTIVGTADNGDGDPFPHAWTLLYLDGKCVYTDVTWDDPFVNGEQREDNISYSYFQLSYEEISRDHFPDQASMALIPSSCNHTGYDYYSVKQGEGTGCGIFSSATTAEEAAKYFTYLGEIDGKDQFYCNFRFEGSGMQAWIAANWQGIASALGLTGTRNVSYRFSSNDAQMTISGTLRSTVSVTSVTLTPGSLNLTAIGMTAQLTATVSPNNATNKAVTFTSSDPSVAIVSDSGLVTAVGSGTSVITVKTNDGGKTAICNVTVTIPVQPEPTVPAPTEPTVTTPPTVTTEPPETTAPPVATEPAETVPSVPTEPTVGTEPTLTTDPITESTVPVTTPTETVPGETENTPSAAPETTQPALQQPTEPAAPQDPDKEINPVLIAALIGGGTIAAVSGVLLWKRR